MLQHSSFTSPICIRQTLPPQWFAFYSHYLKVRHFLRQVPAHLSLQITRWQWITFQPWSLFSLFNSQAYPCFTHFYLLWNDYCDYICANKPDIHFCVSQTKNISPAELCRLWVRWGTSPAEDWSGIANHFLVSHEGARLLWPELLLDKELFTYYVSQFRGGSTTPTPISSISQHFSNPPSPSPTTILWQRHFNMINESLTFV